MKISKSNLLMVSLILEITVTTAGFILYVRGPSPFLTTLKLAKSENLSLSPGEAANCELGFSPAYTNFILNMTVSADLNFTGKGLDMFLLNRTQFDNWNSSNTDFILRKEGPNYNFTTNVEPDEYYLLLEDNLGEKLTVSCNHDAQSIAQSFDYGHVWQFLYLTIIGIVSININIVLMKKERMFVRLDAFAEKVFSPWVELPKGGSKNYRKYRINFYGKFFRPLLSFCFQYLPILLMIFAFLLGYLRTVGANSFFANIMMDYDSLLALTSYPLLILIIGLGLLWVSFTTIRTQDLEFILYKRWGTLKKAYLDELSQIGSLAVSDLRQKKMIALVSVPIVLFVGVVLAFQNYFVLLKEVQLTPLLWSLLGILFAYYGLAFAYRNSKYALTFLGDASARARRARIDSYRRDSLIDGIISSGTTVLSFMPLVALMILVLGYGWQPILSMSVCWKYGLVSSQIANIAPVFAIGAEIVVFASFLYAVIFTGISGYLVPTLLERGVRGPAVASVALVLTFLTERVLSFALKPYVDADLLVSLLPSFAVFVLVMVFEKFYRRLLSFLEESE